jgi:putative transposase
MADDHFTPEISIHSPKRPLALECPARFVPEQMIETGTKELGMARGKKHSAEQIVNLLRQIEVAIANGKTTALGCKEAEITEQTYYRWRKEYGGLKVDQARRLKELEQENAKLKRLVSELSLEKLVLKDIAAGNF